MDQKKCNVTRDELILPRLFKNSNAKTKGTYKHDITNTIRDFQL
jgi:hypothetical protein